MKYIYAAKTCGATVVTIDPILTQTAVKSYLFIRIKAGTDGLPAPGMARTTIDNGLTDSAFLADHSLGYERFKKYVQANIQLSDVSAAG